MGKKKGYNYFEALIDLVKVSGREAKFLVATLDEFEGEIGELQIEQAHAIEHEGDEQKHDVMNRLLSEFITPVEREDIVGIAQKIDDVTDSMEDVLLKLYMFHVKTIRPESREFASLIVKCSDALKSVMKEFHHFKKPAKLGQLMIEVHDLESQGDALYTKAMRQLYGDTSSPVELMIWTEIFRRMEICLDAMEQVADMVEIVIMKNS